MKTLRRASFLATVAASVLGAGIAFGAEGNFPNADTAFGLKAGGGTAAESERNCGTYYDSFRLIGGTAQTGYHDRYKMIGGPEAASQPRQDEVIPGQGRVACSAPAAEGEADKPL